MNAAVSTVAMVNKVLPVISYTINDEDSGEDFVKCQKLSLFVFFYLHSQVKGEKSLCICECYNFSFCWV